MSDIVRASPTLGARTRLRAVRSDEWAREVVSLSGWTAAVPHGRAYVAGDRLDVGGSLSNDVPAFHAENPSGSGVVIQAVRLVLYTSVTQWFRYAEDVPIGDLNNPSDAGTPRQFDRSKADDSALVVNSATGFDVEPTWWAQETRVTNNGEVVLPLGLFVLPPGKTFVVAGDDSNSQQTQVTFYYIEQPV